VCLEETVTAYFVIDLNIPDPQKPREYEAAAGPVLTRYGARVLTRATAGDCDVIEGDRRPRRLVIEEFADRQTIHDRYNDQDNKPLIKMCRAASSARALAVDGIRRPARR
jgi:uncharacterized protein (DUF1330 family)